MGRTKSEINDIKRRLSKLEQNEQRQDKDLKDIKSDIDVFKDDKIIQMLKETNSPYSNKPRYSYDEISTATGRSTGYISNLAKDHGLSRRNLTSAK